MPGAVVHHAARREAPRSPARGPAAHLALTVLAAALAASCSRTPQDPVLALLSRIETAVEARDADRVATHLAPDFQAGHGLGREEALLQMKRTFAGYDSIAIEIVEPAVAQDGDDVRVTCVVEFSGRARKVFGLEGLLPPEAVYRFDLELRRHGEELLLRRAARAPVTGPAAESE